MEQQFDGKGKPLVCQHCGVYMGQNIRGTRRTCSGRCKIAKNRAAKAQLVGAK